MDAKKLPTSFSKLLEPLAKDQLIYRLRSAAARDPFLNSIRAAAADVDPSHRKQLFEGHLLYCESPTGPFPNTAATAEAIAAQLDPVSVGLNHQATALDILALQNRGAATTSANQGPAGYQGNPGSQGAQPPSYESGGGSSY